MDLLERLTDYSIVACILAWMFYKDWKINLRLFRIVENSTKAMTELKDGLKKCKANQI